MHQIGLTTTIPVEVLFAAGVIPVDLNNVFITHPDPHALLRRAERDGYPRNVCGWIKGIYAVTLELGLRRVVAVTQGDCSQTHAMMETLQARGVEIIPFAYPYDRDRALLEHQIERFRAHFGVSAEEVEAARERLRPLREMAAEVDRLTWEEGKVTGAENHLYQVTCSDFEGDPEAYGEKLRSFLAEARERRPREEGLRLGLLGVPPIISGLHDFLESRGAQVVLNEVPRQFTMADSLDEDLVTQYQRYTYPYDVFARIEDLNREGARRRIDGFLHYTQAFCFRELTDPLIRRGVSVPVLTLIGNQSRTLGAGLETRLEAFVDMIERQRK